MKINFIFQIISFGMGFLINLYLLKNLSLSDYGLYSLINTIIILGSMVLCLNIQEYLNLGLNKYKKYSYEQNTFFTKINSLMIINSVIFVIFLILFRDTIVRILNIPEEYSIIIIILVFINIVFANFLRYEVSNGDLMSYNIFLFMNNYFWFFLFFISSFELFNIFIYKLAITSVLVFTYYSFFRRKYNFKQYFTFSINQKSEVYLFGLNSFISTLGLLIIMNSDKIMISIFTNQTNVALYSFALLPFMIIFNLFQNVVLVLYVPKINKLYHKNKSFRFRIYKKLINLILILFIPIFIFFIVFSKQIVLLLSKDEYLESINMFPWLAISLLLYAISFVLKQELLISRNFKFLNTIYLIGVFFNLLLNYVGIIYIGYEAVIYSTIVVYIIINVSLFQWGWKNEKKIKIN